MGCLYKTHPLPHLDTALFFFFLCSAFISPKHTRAQNQASVERIRVNTARLYLLIFPVCICVCVWAVDTWRSRCSDPCCRVHEQLNSLHGTPGVLLECVVGGVHENLPPSFLKRQNIQWLTPYFIFQEFQPSSFHGSNLDIASAAYPFSTRGVDSIYLIPSFFPSP